MQVGIPSFPCSSFTWHILVMYLYSSSGSWSPLEPPGRLGPIVSVSFLYLLGILLARWSILWPVVLLLAGLLIPIWIVFIDRRTEEAPDSPVLCSWGQPEASPEPVSCWNQTAP